MKNPGCLLFDLQNTACPGAGAAQGRARKGQEEGDIPHDPGTAIDPGTDMTQSQH